MNQIENPSAILILTNGKRVVIQNVMPLELIALIGRRYFAGYILNPQSKTIEESRQL